MSACTSRSPVRREQSEEPQGFRRGRPNRPRRPPCRTPRGPADGLAQPGQRVAPIARTFSEPRAERLLSGHPASSMKAIGCFLIRRSGFLAPLTIRDLYNICCAKRDALYRPGHACRNHSAGGAAPGPFGPSYIKSRRARHHRSSSMQNQSKYTPVRCIVSFEKS